MIELRGHAGFCKILVIGLITATFSASAQDGSQKTLPLVSFRETVLPAALVSSDRVVVGLMPTGFTPRHVWEGFEIDLPRNSPDALCINLRSIDGLYQGVAEFDISDVRGGTYTIALATTHKRKLDNYRAGEIAAALRLSAICTAPRDADPMIFPLIGDGASIQDVNVFLQSGGLDVYVEEEGGTEVDCADLADSSDLPNIAFDTRCALPESTPSMTVSRFDFFANKVGEGIVRVLWPETR